MATPQYLVRAVGSGGQLDINVLSPDDNVGYAFGTDSDAVFYLRSTTLSADEELTGVIVGTSDHQATAANSLIISNTTNDGDIQMLVSDDPGNSKEFLLADGSEADLVLGHGMATATIKTASGDLTLSPGGSLSINAATGGAIRLNDTQADVDVIWESDAADNMFHLDASRGNIGLGGTAGLASTVRVYTNDTANNGGAATFLDGGNSQTNAITGNQDTNYGWDFKAYQVTGDSGTRTVVDAATVHIPGPPTAGSNAAVTNPWAFWVDSGNARFDGNVDLNSTGTLLNVGAAGNYWTATTLAHINSHTGVQGLFIHNNSSNDAAGTAAHLELKVSATNGNATGDPRVRFIIHGGSSWAMGPDNSESDRFAIANSTDLGSSADAVRITTSEEITFQNSTGSDYDYVCGGCGKSSLETFDCCGEVEWHDDVLAVRESRLSPEGFQHMAKLGILEIDGPDTTSPGWVGINYQKAQNFTWSGMWQNRLRMDSQYEELNKRLEAIGA